jgi:hypothetical protein
MLHLVPESLEEMEAKFNRAKEFIKSAMPTLPDEYKKIIDSYSFAHVRLVAPLAASTLVPRYSLAVAMRDTDKATALLKINETHASLVELLDKKHDDFVKIAAYIVYFIEQLVIIPLAKQQQQQWAMSSTAGASTPLVSNPPPLQMPQWPTQPAPAAVVLTLPNRNPSTEK